MGGLKGRIEKTVETLCPAVEGDTRTGIPEKQSTGETGDLNVDLLGFLPEMLEAVKLSRFPVKDMSNDRSQVQENPMPVPEALLIAHVDAFLPQPFADPFGNRPDLPVGVTGADDKIVAKIRHLAHVKDDDIFRFLVRGASYDRLCQLSC